MKYSKTSTKLTAMPAEAARTGKGRGHEQPGLGKQGGHRNVVNPASHADKLKHC